MSFLGGRLVSVEFNCSSCGSTLRVDDANRGKMARCPTCQMIVPIPGDADLRETAPLDRPAAAWEQPSSEPKWLVRTPDGTLYGPARRSELLTWQTEGRISPDCRLQQIGQAGWVTPESVLGEANVGTSRSRSAPAPAPSTQSPKAAPVDYSGPLRIRRAHNGMLILILAVLGLFFLPLAIVAVFVGLQELKGMDRGEIDDSGRSLVRAGIAIGIIGAILSFLTNCCCCISISTQRIRG